MIDVRYFFRTPVLSWRRWPVPGTPPVWTLCPDVWQRPGISVCVKKRSTREEIIHQQTDQQQSRCRNTQ